MICLTVETKFKENICYVIAVCPYCICILYSVFRISNWFNIVYNVPKAKSNYIVEWRVSFNRIDETTTYLGADGNCRFCNQSVDITKYKLHTHIEKVTISKLHVRK